MAEDELQKSKLIKKAEELLIYADGQLNFEQKIGYINMSLAFAAIEIAESLQEISRTIGDIEHHLHESLTLKGGER